MVDEVGKGEGGEFRYLAVCTAGRAPDAVDVVARVVRGVELDYPVDGWDVEATGCDICADEDAGGSVNAEGKLENDASIF